MTTPTPQSLEEPVTLRPVITRVVILISWGVSLVVSFVAGRIVYSRYGWDGVALLVAAIAPMHFFFWSGQRIRVELHESNLVIVRPFSKARVARSSIRSGYIGSGKLWGEMIILRTDDGDVRVPVFQASRMRSDSWTHQDMWYAMQRILAWAGRLNDPDRD